MAKKWLWILFGIFFLLSALWLQGEPAARAEDVEPIKQIQQVLNNQKEILQNLQDIKKELNIIRIRVN